MTIFYLFLYEKETNGEKAVLGTPCETKGAQIPEIVIV